MYRSGFLAILEDLLVRELFPHDLRRNMTMVSFTLRQVRTKTHLISWFALLLPMSTNLTWEQTRNHRSLMTSSSTTTYHLMAITDVWFPNRHQQSTLRKAISLTSSSARPGTLVEASGYIRSNNELKWEDVNPEDPTCQVLLMRVKHRLNKGKRNKGVPWVLGPYSYIFLIRQRPVFTHTERNDNLGICIIRDIRTRISWWCFR
jgi:hypothetical protein